MFTAMTIQSDLLIDGEFGIMKFSDGTDHVSTSHMNGGEYGSSAMMADPILNLDPTKLIEHDHSHPGNVKTPSGLIPEGADPSGREADIQRAQRAAIST